MLTNILAQATITAYCSCFHCCPLSSHGLTAAGIKPQQGITIAASRKIPLGSKVIVNNHTYTVQDRLAKRFDNRFDIYFNSHKDALQFGKKQLTVTIITTTK